MQKQNLESTALTNNDCVTQISQSENSVDPDDGTSSCRICCRGFKSTQAIEKHLSSGSCTDKTPNLNSNGSTVLCHAGNQSFSDDFDSENNLQTGLFYKESRLKSNKVYQCCLCSATFTDMAELVMHSKTENFRGALFPCKMCGRIFNKEHYLKSHATIHVNICDKCNKCFPQKYSLTRHYRLHNQEKLFSCNLCDKKYTEKGKFDYHYRTHTNELLFTCEMCNKRFNNRRCLKAHYVVHLDEKPHECVVCDKRFLYKSCLKSHYLTHTKEKPHVCEICQRSFSERNNLRRHRLVHTKEKPHVCLICDKSFTHSNSLKSHYNMHTREGSKSKE